MAWLFFMDESGHDHRQMPYEVRGGFVLEDCNLWRFVRDVMALELMCFGARLVDYKSEIKGEKLLNKSRFNQLQKDKREPFPRPQRQQLCRSLLQGGLEKKPPTRDQLTAYSQACLLMADELFQLLGQHGAKIFAVAVPKGAAKPPLGAEEDLLRKDHTFLFERFFYFLEEQRQTGILVMDEADKTTDQRFVTRLHGYFTTTFKGKSRTKWIVPSPFFVSSDMAIPVQVADVVVYCINWGFRHRPDMEAKYRPEIYARYGPQMGRLKWHGEGYDGIKSFPSFGVFCVPDLFTPRK